MSIVDLLSMAVPEKERREAMMKALSSLGEGEASFCFQCGKCTSGCEAYILQELEPHKVMLLSKSGFVDELVNSEIIWTCMGCLKCKERCPQRLAPIEVLYTLKNIAVASGKEIHSGHTAMLQSVLECGMVQSETEVLDADNKAHKREALGLPPLKSPANMEKFQQVVMESATEAMG